MVQPVPRSSPNGVKSAPQRGVYTLVIHLPRELDVRIGRLGTRRLKRGFYTYTGSALGMGPASLPGRVMRHLRGFKAKLWHIDYLLASRGVYVMRVVAAETATNTECTTNLSLKSELNAEVPVPGFGSSDCRAGCGSHLLYLGTRDPVNAIPDIYRKLGLNPFILEINDVTGSTRIRPALSEDLERLYEIERECFGQEAYPKALLASLTMNSGFMNFIAEVDGEIAGFILGCMKRVNAKKIGHIYTVDVADQFRRRGVANMLLDRMERIFWFGGARDCYLEVRVDNMAARNLYWKRGYVDVGRLEDYYGDGIHGIQLKKRLNYG